MGGSHSRTKGHDFERLVARALRVKWPDAKRGLQDREGEHCPDVLGTPYYIECKRYKTIVGKIADKWLAHAKEKRDLFVTGSSFCMPVVLITKKDRYQPSVVGEISEQEADDIYNMIVKEQYAKRNKKVLEVGRRTNKRQGVIRRVSKMRSTTLQV